MIIHVLKIVIQGKGHYRNLFCVILSIDLLSYLQIFGKSADCKNESADHKQEICRFCLNLQIFNYFCG